MQLTVTSTVESFQSYFGVQPSCLGWAPGRVNLIGEYTDLNDGLVMPMAIDLGTCAALRIRDDSKIIARSTRFDQAFEFDLSVAPEELSDPWLRYVLGVATLVNDARGVPTGFELLVHSDLPETGGVSSSASLTTAICLALQGATGWEMTGKETARLCQRVEHEFSGVFCGIMDQLACRLGEQDSVLFIDCATMEIETLPFPSDASLIVVDSGVPRSLHATAYNQRRVECAEVLSVVALHEEAITNLRELDANALDALEESLDPLMFRRCRHVVTENARVESARRALLKNDLSELGELMISSHASLRDDFEVSVPELDHIVATSTACAGAYGARLTGAGFGGNAIVLVENSAVEHATAQIATAFNEQFGRTPSTFCVTSSNPARSIVL